MTDKIRAALEVRLNSLSPAISTAWENTKFEPVNGTPYQRVNLLYANPDNLVLGCDRRTETGIMQITLCYPLNLGATQIEDRANALISHFARGTVMTNSGQSVQVTRTPSKRVLGNDGAVFKMAVSIYYRADVIG